MHKGRMPSIATHKEESGNVSAIIFHKMRKGMVTVPLHLRNSFVSTVGLFSCLVVRSSEYINAFCSAIDIQLSRACGYSCASFSSPLALSF